MKWIVVWIVINSWIVPCDNGSTEYVDEYGRKHISTMTTLQCCYDSETKSMEREFDTLEAAQAFADELRGLESYHMDSRIENIEIREVKTIK